MSQEDREKGHEEVDYRYFEFLRDRLNHSDDPEDLAIYVEAGAELGPELRAEIATIIRNYAPRPRGGKDSLRDKNLYERVEGWRSRSRDEIAVKNFRHEHGRNPEGLEFFDLPRGETTLPTINDALEYIIENDPKLALLGGDVNVETLRRQYERGRKLLNK